MADTPQGVLDADGVRWIYRRVSSVLERRRSTSGIWQTVTGTMFETMTPAELRHVAMVLEVGHG
jgi:hypothetical protein